MAQFEGTVLLPELNEEEKKDLIPERRLVVTKKSDGTVVLDQKFPVSQRSIAYRPVELGDVLTVSLFNIDEAGNEGTNPRVDEITVVDTEPPTAQPGALSHSFHPIVE